MRGKQVGSEESSWSRERKKKELDAKQEKKNSTESIPYNFGRDFFSLPPMNLLLVSS